MESRVSLIATRWLLAASVWCLLAGTVLAKFKEEPEAPPEKSYVIPYMVVVICIGLGMVVLCRPASRAAEPKAPVQEED